MSREITTPARATADYMSLYKGLGQEQASALDGATYLACQAVLECGPDASIEEVLDHAMVPVHDDDPEVRFLPGQVFQAVDGEFGVLVSDLAWQVRCERMQELAQLFRAYITARQGES